MNHHAQYQNSRRIVARIVITGRLVLDTPANFGNGDAEGLADIPLLRDALDGAPLLTGASLAGALRNYLREYDGGYASTEQPSRIVKSRAELLFGHLDDSNPQRRASVQSWLVVDDARGAAPEGGPDVELRDGVSIDPATRTARANDQGRGQKYDYELLVAGTTFPFCCELALTAEQQRSGELLGALVDALGGFASHPSSSATPTHDGEQIGLGMRKRRGLGACHMEEWRTYTYDLTSAPGLLAWLRQEGAPVQAGLPSVLPTTDRRQALHLVAQFDLTGSLLIRAESGDINAPDMVHLRSWRDHALIPVLPGTSVAGAMRGRALRIANTMLGTSRGEQLVDAVFGRTIRRHTDEPFGSLLSVAETTVQAGVDAIDRVQNRVKIDRFTSGAYPKALFSQQPLWSGEGDRQAGVVLDLTLRQPVAQEAQRERDFAAGAGLLLLVLKDLWTGDLPLGGESGVGRGCLAGRTATLRYGDMVWTLAAQTRGTDAVAVSGDLARLEAWIEAFLAWPNSAERRQASKEGAA